MSPLSCGEKSVTHATTGAGPHSWNEFIGTNCFAPVTQAIAGPALWLQKMNASLSIHWNMELVRQQVWSPTPYCKCTLWDRFTLGLSQYEAGWWGVADRKC